MKTYIKLNQRLIRVLYKVMTKWCNDKYIVRAIRYIVASANYLSHTFV